MFRKNNENDTDIEKLKRRYEVLDHLKFEVKRLETKEKAIHEKYVRKKRKMLQEQQDLNELCDIDLDSTMSSLPGNISWQNRENTETALTLLKLISKKYSIEKVNGKYNNVQEVIKISFPNGVVVGSEIQGEQAIQYFKSLGCKVFKKGSPGHLGYREVKVNSAKCASAFQGLDLLTDLTPEEKEQRKQATQHMRC